MAPLLDTLGIISQVYCDKVSKSIWRQVASELALHKDTICICMIPNLQPNVIFPPYSVPSSMYVHPRMKWFSDKNECKIYYPYILSSILCGLCHTIESIGVYSVFQQSRTAICHCDCWLFLMGCMHMSCICELVSVGNSDILITTIWAAVCIDVISSDIILPATSPLAMYTEN